MDPMAGIGLDDPDWSIFCGRQPLMADRIESTSTTGSSSIAPGLPTEGAVEPSETGPRCTARVFASLREFILLDPVTRPPGVHLTRLVIASAVLKTETYRSPVRVVPNDAEGNESKGD